MIRVLKIMIDIFDPQDVDWMNFAVTKKNKFSYHHIVPKRNGGEVSIDNGAILTKRAHNLLHKLEEACPDAYNDLQDVFCRINLSKRPATNDIIKEIDRILYKLFILHEYEFKENVDFSSYMGLYYEGKKRIRKHTR